MSFSNSLNPEQKRRLSGAIQSVVVSLERQKAESDNIKEIGSDIKEEFGIEPAKLKKIAKARMENDFTKIEEEYTTLADLWEVVGE